MKALYEAKFREDMSPIALARPIQTGSNTSSGGRSIRWVSSAPIPADPAPTADEHRMRRIVDWLDYAVELGASGLALGPVFASRTHGYDTTDHYRIDPRLGEDADFDHLVAEAHQRGLRVLLDGVFNHVGTDFPRYRDAVAGGDASWFRVRGGQFETFEGHDGLIALNHDKPEVIDYTVDVMATGWAAEPTGGASTPPTRSPTGSGHRCSPGACGVPASVVRRRGHPR